MDRVAGSLRLRLGARLLPGICAALAVFVVMPAGASACASLAGVHSFAGHARMTFEGTASGPVEGSGGSETVALKRSAANVKIILNHKLRGRGLFANIVIFSGRASLGQVSVHDSFDLGGSDLHATETHGGPLPASLGGAALTLDTANCKYQLTAHFGARTMFSGDATLKAGDLVSGSAFSDRNQIPKNLHLIGGAGPTAYLELSL